MRRLFALAPAVALVLGACVGDDRATPVSPTPDAGGTDAATAPDAGADTDSGGDPDAGAPWTPAALGNVVAWFDGDSNVTVSGTANVSAWGDKSANALSALQGAVALQPTVSTDLVNGHKTIRFAASCKYLRVSDGDALHFGTTSFTVAVVGSFANNVEAKPGAFVAKRQKDSPYAGILLRGDGDANAALRGYVQLNRFVDSTKTSLNDRKLHRIVYRRLPDNTLDLRVDEAPSMQTFDDATNVDAAGVDLLLGADNQENECLDGDVAEVLLLNRSLTPAETLQLEGYFKSKYAL
jgi:hypothetical protein